MKLRSTKEIARKANQLEEHYKTEVIKAGYHENMGDKYCARFNSYVGYIEDYPYFDRLAILSIRAELFQFVISPIPN